MYQNKIVANCQWINNKSVYFYKIEHCPYMREGDGSIFVEKANTSDDLANYLDLTLRATINSTPSYMTHVMILISTLSIFHSFRAISHLALHMVFIFPS